MLAPNTLRIPTSYFLCTAINDTRPYNPRHEIKTAIPANVLYKRAADVPVRRIPLFFVHEIRLVRIFGKVLIQIFCTLIPDDSQIAPF